mmetsp:Transcript_26383/g.66040  ORF Transcript_26383/g.66040 Transcript_26383/m.66040 type:complete len:252 (-) Transcript_26383:1077-1832(-)
MIGSSSFLRRGFICRRFPALRQRRFPTCPTWTTRRSILRTVATAVRTRTMATAVCTRTMATALCTLAMAMAATEAPHRGKEPSRKGTATMLTKVNGSRWGTVTMRRQRTREEEMQAMRLTLSMPGKLATGTAPQLLGKRTPRRTGVGARVSRITTIVHAMFCFIFLVVAEMLLKTEGLYPARRHELSIASQNGNVFLSTFQALHANGGIDYSRTQNQIEPARDFFNTMKRACVRYPCPCAHQMHGKSPPAS